MSPIRYRDAGVDIDAGEEAVRRIKDHVRSTFGDQVVGDVGAFAGLVRIPGGDPNRYLVTSIDGVGTKLKVAMLLTRYDTVGEDLVNHCVGDIAVHGAQPLCFLDYIAMGQLVPELVEQVVIGAARGCRANGVALVGGETAEMPGVYTPPEFDVAGCIVGTVDRDVFVDGSAISVGDHLVGIRSTGLHTNGYSLARKVLFDADPVDPAALVPGTGTSIGDALLAVHRSYLPELSELRGRSKGAAHITGGGLPGNVRRVLPPGMDAVIHLDRWTVPPLFRFLGARGAVPQDDLYRTFNMGIGLVVALAPTDAETFIASHPEDRIVVGEVTPGDGTVRLVGEPRA